MRGVVLAGGFGTRLRPLTINLPKPMAPVANQPMMEHVIRLCERHGFNDLLALLHYSPEVITRHFESGKNWDVTMNYLKPDEDLGTAGCITTQCGSWPNSGSFSGRKSATTPPKTNW